MVPVISAIEYGIVNYGATATLRATTPELYFLPGDAWYDLDSDAAHNAMASRVLLRSEARPPVFVSNVVVQYFTLGRNDIIRLSEIDTTLDITALEDAVVLGHTSSLNGYRCTDEGTYTADNLELRVHRSQIAYATANGDSALSIFTGTTPGSEWEQIEQEITEMEDRWLKTITNSAAGEC